MVVVVIILLLACLGGIFALKRMHAQLCTYRKSDKMKTVFIKGISREVRTHLHSVTGLAEIIARDDLYLSKTEKRTISSQIKYNTGLISTLLDEVSVFSDDNREGHKLLDERFSPNILAQRCIEANRSMLQEGVRISFRRELSDSFFVSTDRHIVELVMNKLVFCACKFTQKGEVVVGCRCGDPAHLLTFYVEDTGVGIPEDRKGSLFSWFDNPDDVTEDTEFDLSISQRLAAKVGGFLRQDVMYTKGTRMEFVLPVR